VRTLARAVCGETTADCPRKRPASVSDQCHARCPDLPDGDVIRNPCYLIAMKLRATALERAFQLAKSCSCTSLIDIKKRLTAEGYSTDQITGGALSKQLRALIQTALKSPGGPPKKLAPPVDEQDGGSTER
jgi:hypothetical protein